MTTPRRIVQITGTEVLYALDEDGQLWRMPFATSQVMGPEPWQPVPLPAREDRDK